MAFPHSCHIQSTISNKTQIVWIQSTIVDAVCRWREQGIHTQICNDVQRATTQIYWKPNEAIVLKVSPPYLVQESERGRENDWGFEEIGYVSPVTIQYVNILAKYMLVLEDEIISFHFTLAFEGATILAIDFVYSRYCFAAKHRH